jgi:CMP-N-acetylneuraminic acid synthetase
MSIDCTGSAFTDNVVLDDDDDMAVVMATRQRAKVRKVVCQAPLANSVTRFT